MFKPTLSNLGLASAALTMCLYHTGNLQTIDRRTQTISTITEDTACKINSRIIRIGKYEIHQTTNGIDVFEEGKPNAFTIDPNHTEIKTQLALYLHQPSSSAKETIINSIQAKIRATQTTCP